MGKVQTTYTTSFTPSWYTSYAKDILSGQANLANQPYQAYGGPRIQGFTPTQQQGMGMTQQAATGYQPTLQQATETAQGTLGRSSLGAAAPLLGQAANPMGLRMASPFLGQAAQSSAAGVGQFMDPFLENVVNRYGELGQRTLREQLMPGITNKYIQAGQLGGPTRPGTGASGAPSGMMTDTARALRDVQEGVGQQQMQALSQGYGQALSASQAEQQRMGQLAQTAGGLGQQQQQIMSTLGGQVGSMYGADTANQLAASGQLASLAQQQQQQGLAGASAVTGVGAQEQALGQANLDVAYQDYLRQSGYPQAQIDQMIKAMQGVAPAMPTGSVTSGNAATASNSLLGTALGGAMTLGGAYLAGQK